MATGVNDPRLNDPEWLRSAYANRSLQSIADEIGVSNTTVHKRLIKFGIPRRALADHFKGRQKPPEQRRKMADTRQRYWDTHPEAHERMSAWLKKYWAESPNRDEHREKIAQTKRRATTTRGYVRRPYTRKAEHRAVMEDILGRPMLRTEEVHHNNGDKADNRPENLRYFATHGEHMRFHMLTRSRSQGGKFAPEHSSSVSSLQTN